MHNASFGLAFHDKACGFSDQEVADLRYLARMLACDLVDGRSVGKVAGIVQTCILEGEVPDWIRPQMRYWVDSFLKWGVPDDHLPPVAAVANPTEEG